MVYNMRTSPTIYVLFILILMVLTPLNVMAAPQSADITKPTRERVKKSDDKKSDNKKSDNKKTDNKKSDNKPATSPAKQDNKPSTAKPAEQPAKPEAAPAAANDTANKPAPKPKARTTTNPDNTQFDGIDVSKHQGTINWEELRKNSKIKYVYIKATEGSDYTDPLYRENLRNARKQGFKVGSYHFLSTKSSVTRQFQNFITVAKREEQDLLPVIDVERINPWTSQQLRDSLKVFADLLEDYYGCKPLIYTSEKFFTKHLGRAFADYPLFIAKYSNTQPNIGYKWILWQFADNGLFKSAVRGNYGEVDLSRFNKGCSINDILYNPSKHKPKNPTVREAVDHKDKPSSVSMSSEQKPKEAPKASKRQQEEAQKQAEKERKDRERNKKLAEQEKKKQEEADKKAREKAEQQRKADARKKAREDAEKKAAEDKAKRKASAQEAKKKKAERQSASQSSRSSSLLSSSSSRLSQSQRNDSIRNASSQGRKTNKSSPDND